MKLEVWSCGTCGKATTAAPPYDEIAFIEGTMFHVFELDLDDDYSSVEMWTPRFDKWTQVQMAVLASLAIGNVPSAEDAPFHWSKDDCPRLYVNADEQWHVYRLENGWACTCRVISQNEVYIASGFPSPEEAFRLVVDREMRKDNTKVLVPYLHMETMDLPQLVRFIVEFASTTLVDFAPLALDLDQLESIAESVLVAQNWRTLQELLEQVRCAARARTALSDG